MREARYYRSLAVLLTASLASAGAARAASLHFIMLADTLDLNIGSVRDVYQCDNWAGNIASHTGLDLDLDLLFGKNLTTANARRLLDKLTPTADDVVWLIYSGHGANAGNSEWPVFTMLADTTDAPLTFDEAVSILQPKPQRMLIVMADCCNVVVPALGGVTRPVEPSGRAATTSANLQHLFVDFRGTVLVTSSSVGQTSLGNSTDGGLFLNTFMDDVGSLAAGTIDLTWDKLLGTTAADVTKQAALYISEGAAENTQPQQPHYVINLEQVAAAMPDPPASEVSTPAAPATAGCGALGATSIAMIGLFWLALRIRR